MKKLSSKGFSAIEGLLILVLVGLIGFVGWYVWHNRTEPANQPAILPTAGVVTPKVETSTKTADVKTVKYTSSYTGSSFTYPSTWTKVTAIKSYESKFDTFAIKSPSGLVKLTWVSTISGFGGGGCDPKLAIGAGPGGEFGLRSCPQLTLLNKEKVSGAEGLFVVEGTLTNDNVHFEPWIGVQSSESQEFLTSKRADVYPLFTLNKKIDKWSTIFCSSETSVSGPKLSKSEAEAWFSKDDVKAAKEILLSLKP